MRKIFTYLSITVMSIVGICFAIFYFFGIAAEYKFKEIIHTIDILTNQNVKVANYQRHWFSSDAVIMVTIDPHYLLSWQDKKIEALVGAMAQKSFLRTVVIEAHIKHGPLIYTANGIKLVQALIDAKVVLNAEQNALLQRTLPMPSLATASALINILGDGHVYINSSKFSYHGTNVNMLWKGFAWRLDFSRALDDFRSYFDFFGYDLDTDNLDLKLSNFKFTSTLSKIADQLLPSYKLFLLPYFQCKINDSSNIVINNLHYQSFLRSSGEKDKLSSNVSLQVSNFGFNEFNYRNINFVWHADKLDAKIFADLVNEVMRARQEEKLTGMQAAYFFEILLKLLNNDAVLDINKLEAVTPWGKLNVTANATFKKRLSHAGWLLSLLANSQAVVNVRLEQGVALYLLQQYYKTKGTDDAAKWQLQAQTTLTALKRDNKLLEDNGFYSFSLNYENRKLLLNNQPFSWVDEK